MTPQRRAAAHDAVSSMNWRLTIWVQRSKSAAFKSSHRNKFGLIRESENLADVVLVGRLPAAASTRSFGYLLGLDLPARAQGLL